MGVKMTQSTLSDKKYDYKNIVIISGGQTGADQGGLEGAKMAGFQTGGFVPRGFKTEKGSMPELRDKFRLIESTSPDYVYRTHLNAKFSSITLWFGNNDSAGYIATEKACKTYRKPFYNVDSKDPDFIVDIIKKEKPMIINVAGNRESKCPGIQESVRIIMYAVLSRLKE